MKKAPTAGYSVCFWQRTYGRNSAFPDIQHRAMVGTVESLEQEEDLGSYWKALGPSRSHSWKVKTVIPTVFKRTKKEEEERK